MMTKKHKHINTSIALLMLLAFFSIPVTTFAQTDEPILQKPDVDIMGEMYIPIYGVTGSAFVFEDWKPSDLVLSNGKLVHVKSSKFDHYHNNYVYYNETLMRMFKVEPAAIDEFFLFNKSDTLHFVRHNVSSGFSRLEKGMFIQLLSDGKYRFAIYHESYIMDPYSSNELANIVYNKRYFVQTDGHINEIRLKKKSVLQLFPDRKKELGILMNKLHVRKKNENSFVRFFDAMNQ